MLRSLKAKVSGKKSAKEELPAATAGGRVVPGAAGSGAAGSGRGAGGAAGSNGGPGARQPNAGPGGGAAAGPGGGHAGGAAAGSGGGAREKPPLPPLTEAAMQQHYADPLPSFRDVPPADKQLLFVQKLHLCAFAFDFSNPSRHVREKEIKRQTLLELVDYANSGQGKFTEGVSEDIVFMLASNLFRTLPPTRAHDADNFDPEEEEPTLEPAWPHLQARARALTIVYEFLLRYIVSNDTDAKVAKKYVDQHFVLKLLELFDSEDPRERDYLKTILHRIYGGGGVGPALAKLRSFLDAIDEDPNIDLDGPIKRLRQAFFKEAYKTRQRDKKGDSGDRSTRAQRNQQRTDHWLEQLCHAVVHEQIGDHAPAGLDYASLEAAAAAAAAAEGMGDEDAAAAAAAAIAGAQMVEALQAMGGPVSINPDGTIVFTPEQLEQLQQLQLQQLQAQPELTLEQLQQAAAAAGEGMQGGQQLIGPDGEPVTLPADGEPGSVEEQQLQLQQLLMMQQQLALQLQLQQQLAAAEAAEAGEGDAAAAAAAAAAGADGAALLAAAGVDPAAAAALMQGAGVGADPDAAAAAVAAAAAGAEAHHGAFDAAAMEAMASAAAAHAPPSDDAAAHGEGGGEAGA
ncbi:hypothetical protein Rsub_13091 [Raphidocelis subcapitata]|uniref:Uncharacterized protein n=1 Tax=Raphidocelis subcapitata TaxID=307507 RepID=A0A2V0PKV9_9CHLO|nr:hypothetical protein Rsub_13091 [Raphidocelis subcapitata]|eukprot:GBG00435.1 hypothetical protein Rsub_13091 [Raphidocelis subcapitata]